MKKSLILAAALAGLMAVTVIAAGPARSITPATPSMVVPVDRQTYIARIVASGPATGSTLDPYAGDSSSIHVAMNAGEEEAESFVHLAFEDLPLGAHATQGRMTLYVTQQSEASNRDSYPIYNVNTHSAVIEACVLTSQLSVELDASNPPTYDCQHASVVGTPNPAGDAWTFELKDLIHYWNAHGNTGAALIPVGSGDPALNWAVGFYKQRSTSTVSYTVQPVPAPTAAVTQTPGPVPSAHAAPQPMGSAAPAVPAVTAQSAAPEAPQIAGLSSSAEPPTKASDRVSSGVIQNSVVQAKSLPAGSSWRWPVWGLLFAIALGLSSRSGVRTWRRFAGRVKAAQRWVVGRLADHPYQQVIRASAAIAGLLAGWVALRVILPQGLPTGVLVLGVILGSLTGLSAVGLVLVYRVIRAINLAQVEIGGLAAATALILVIGDHVPYLVAVACALIVAALSGLVIEAVMHRFRNAPRLIVTVATVGVAQILAGMEIAVPHLVSHLGPATSFTTPFHFHFTVSPVTFTGDSLVALVTVPLVIFGLSASLTRTDTGRALRAVADSHERALLVGIPIRRMMRMAWVLAALLSAIGAVLAAPITGTSPGAAVGPEALLLPVAAAAIGRMEKLNVTFAAAVALGVIQQGLYWSYPSFLSISDAVLFVVIAVTLLLSRRTTSRSRDQGLGHYSAIREVRPVDQRLAALPAVRATRVGGRILVVAIAVAVPYALSAPNVIVMTYMAIFALIAVSLVVLSGWGGQVSFGQFAFAGAGAAITAEAISAHHLDLFLALGAGAAIAALAAVLVGVPVLKLSGQFAGVITLAFAVPVSTILLNANHFPSLNPVSLARPVVLDRFPLDSTRAFYYLCLAALALAYQAARRMRASRTGRALLAVRDNELAASGWSIAPTRIKITTYAVSGAIAGVAGGLYVIGLRGMPYQGFSPVASLQVFTMVVIGGLGSLQGAIAGAIYVVAMQSLFSGAAQLFATGAGLLVLLLIAPEGLGGLMFRARDWWYATLSRPGTQSTATSDETVELAPGPVAVAGKTPSRNENAAQSGTAKLKWEDVDAGYGKLQVLFRADGMAADGEILALLGTNGAGKSTLLRVLSGITAPSRGRVIFDGADITQVSPGRRLKMGIVTVQGGHGVFPSLTVEENLRLMAWTVRNDDAAVARGFAQTYEAFPRLAERRAERAGQLSGGEQQMLACAQPLICPTKLLLIDELTLGLSPATVTTLLGLVRQIAAQGTTVVLVEQSLNTAASVAKRCVFMERGQTRYVGTVTGLMHREDLARAVFLRDTGAPGAPALVQPGRSDESAEAALIVKGVTKSFGGIVAVDGVTLEVPAGQITGLIGPNGAGKTTLLDICSGFVTPDRGRVIFDGADVTDLAAHERAALGLGRVFQDARLVPTLTVREVVATALERHLSVRDPLAAVLGLAAARRSEYDGMTRADELVAEFGLSRYANSFISELSTGTRRVVELACAVAHQPSVLLLDEPTAGIAQRETEVLADMLANLRLTLGMTMVIVEHDLNFVHTLANRLVCLDLGRELVAGSPDEVLDNPAVLRAYFGIDKPTRGSRARKRGAGTEPKRQRLEATRTTTHSNGNAPNRKAEARTMKASPDTKAQTAPLRPGTPMSEPVKVSGSEEEE